MSHTTQFDDWQPEKATSRPDGYPDTAIVPYVEALRDAGVETYNSCSGHIVTAEGEEYYLMGVLWFNDPRFNPREAGASEVFDRVSRVYGKREVPVWEVTFPGLSESRASLERSMTELFRNIGVEVPDSVEHEAQR